MKVTLLMALTADGKIAKHDKHFPDWTETEDKKMFKAVSVKAGVVIMGSKTFDAIGAPLPHRKNVVLTRNRLRHSDSDNLVFTRDTPEKILADLAASGYDHAVLIGGAEINALFAAAGLIDDMILTYCPKVFGTGIPLFAEEISMDLELKETKKIGRNSVTIHYAVIR